MKIVQMFMSFYYIFSEKRTYFWIIEHPDFQERDTVERLEKLQKKKNYKKRLYEISYSHSISCSRKLLLMFCNLKSALFRKSLSYEMFFYDLKLSTSPFQV